MCMCTGVHMRMYVYTQHTCYVFICLTCRGSHEKNGLGTDEKELRVGRQKGKDGVVKDLFIPSTGL